jgi:hypothetical protein
MPDFVVLLSFPLYNKADLAQAQTIAEAVAAHLNTAPTELGCTVEEVEEVEVAEK